MLLLLIRHAVARERDAAKYPDDSLRPLVRKGEKIQQSVGRKLRKQKLVPKRVLSSPWKRAWQTARILVEETGLPRKARIACPALAGPPDPAALSEAIGTAQPDEIIALVGHEPWIPELAALLLTGKTDGIRIDFPKSGVLGIELAEFVPGTGTLNCFLRP
ncbi:MAG: SixA phosphatase family protein [Gemmatimonadales bacterium]